jgi:16S rRNA processing protein RimM
MPPSTPQKRPAPRGARVDVDVPEGYLAVGRITGAHGLRGEVKVELFTDFPERFAPGTVLALGEDLEEVEVRSMRPHKGSVLVAFDAFPDRTAAESLRGQWLFVPEDDAAELEEGAYWVHDILGMEVVSDEGPTLGTVADVLFTGANEPYVVRDPEGREILLPATDEVVRAVDLPNRRMTFHLLPGIAD